MSDDLLPVDDGSHRSSAVGQNIFAAVKSDVAMMRPDKLVFEKNNRILAVIADAGDAAKTGTSG